jgi:hypothetical protein
MKSAIKTWLAIGGLLIAAGTPSFGQASSLGGLTVQLQGTLKGKLTESWIGQGVAAGSNITTVVSNLTAVNYTSVNAWPQWKAQLTFNTDGTFVYYDIDLFNTQVNTTPSTPPIVTPGPTRNDNWRRYTGTWSQKGKIVTLTLDTSATGEAALYRFYGVNTVPAIPASGDGLFAGQAATANVPTLYTGNESANSLDYFYTYQKAFLGNGNPAWSKRYYVWKGKLDSKGSLHLVQSTTYQIPNLADIGFSGANSASPETDLYRTVVKAIVTKDLTSQ